MYRVHASRTRLIVKPGLQSATFGHLETEKDKLVMPDLIWHLCSTTVRSTSICFARYCWRGPNNHYDKQSRRFYSLAFVCLIVPLRIFPQTLKPAFNKVAFETVFVMLQRAAGTLLIRYASFFNSWTMKLPSPLLR